MFRALYIFDVEKSPETIEVLYLEGNKLHILAQGIYQVTKLHKHPHSQSRSARPTALQDCSLKFVAGY